MCLARQELERFVSAAHERWGRVDALVNNAGTASAKAFVSVTDAEWEEDLQLKLFAAVRAVRLVVPRLRAAGGGAIVNVLSIKAKEPGKNSMPSSVSRAAGLALTKALSKELGPDGIRVNAVLVGMIESGQWARRAEASGKPPEVLYARDEPGGGGAARADGAGRGVRRCGGLPGVAARLVSSVARPFRWTGDCPRRCEARVSGCLGCAGGVGCARMKPSRSCPHCAQPLEAFLVNSPAGAEVELERCTSCGGYWGERGRIQDHFGPSAQYQLVGGTTTRHCVDCRILMTPATLPAGIDVEACPACRGMFLDAEELAQVGARTAARAQKRPGLPQPAGAARAAPTPRAAEPEAPVIALEEKDEVTPVNVPGTFECVACHKRKPLREGQALGEGLACRPCMRKRLKGGEDEDLGLRNLLFGRPKKS